MSSMVWKTVGTILVLREDKQPPSDEEWSAFLTSVAAYRKRVSELRVLIITDGGGPTSSQRASIKGAIEGHPFRSAVISDSMKIRFIAAAIMLISKNHGSFTTRETERAYEHLSLTPDERSAVVDAVRQLDRELKGAAMAG